MRSAERWPDSETALDQLRTLHCELARLSKVAEFLVYEEAAFPNYLKRAVTDATHLFTRPPAGAVARGFCHLRSMADVLFLNNIYLADSLRGEGVGRQLLRESIHMMRAPQHQTIALDVFESNGRAYAWYKRLGFEEIARTSWFSFEIPTDALTGTGVEVRPDVSGFNQIYDGGHRIGTMIANRASLSSMSAISRIGADLATKVIVRLSDGADAGEGRFLDASYRMRAPLAPSIVGTSC